MPTLPYSIEGTCTFTSDYSTGQFYDETFHLCRDMNGNTILHLVAANGAAHLVDTLLRIEGY